MLRPQGGKGVPPGGTEPGLGEVAAELILEDELMEPRGPIRQSRKKSEQRRRRWRGMHGPGGVRAYGTLGTCEQILCPEPGRGGGTGQGQITKGLVDAAGSGIRFHPRHSRHQVNIHCPKKRPLLWKVCQLGGLGSVVIRQRQAEGLVRRPP